MFVVILMTMADIIDQVLYYIEIPPCVFDEIQVNSFRQMDLKAILILKNIILVKINNIRYRILGNQLTVVG